MVKFYIYSYGRAGKILTHRNLLDEVWKVVVCEKQYEDYKKAYGKNKLIVIPNELDGTINKKRNAVMNLDCIADDEYFVLADDDIKSLIRIGDGSYVDKKSTQQIFENLASMCQDIGANLGGLAVTSDRMKNPSHTPFSLTKPVWWLWLIRRSGIKWDEELLRGGDVNFCLEHLRRDRLIIRDNRFFCRRDDNNKDTGIGMAEITLTKYTKILQRRWGSDCVVLDENDLVKSVKSPIKGV